MSPEDIRLQLALSTLERNRAIIRARFTPHEDLDESGERSSFPRSATLRWLFAALSNRQLMAAALQAVLGKHPFIRTLAAWAMSGNSR